MKARENRVSWRHLVFTTPVLVALLAGCATRQRLADGGAEAQTQERAEAAVRSAELLGSWRTPEERASRMSATVDVLSYGGDAEHSTYSIRTQGEGRDGFGSTHTATACFGVEFDAWSGHLNGDGDCPADAEPLVVEAPPVGTLPPTTVDDLSASLAAVASNSSADTSELVQTLRTTLQGAEVAVADDGAIGVAYSAGRDCVLGRITAARSVEVWVPPRVVVAPGELGCTGDTAADGLATQPPH